MFIAAFRRSHHWSLFCAKRNKHTTTHPHYLRSIYYYPPTYAEVPSGLLRTDIPTKIVSAFLIPSIQATCSTHLIFLDLITLIIFGEAYKLRSSSLCSLFQAPATSSLLGPRSRVLLEKLTGTQIVKKLSTFYGTRRFITVFRRAPPLVPILSPMHQVHTFPIYFPKIHSHIITLRSMRRFSDLFLPFRFSKEKC